MKKITLISMFLMSFQLFAAKPLPTVDYVDLDKFVGKWVTITSLPKIFTRGCLYQTADYAINEESNVSVLNTCIKRNKLKKIWGVATVDDLTTNADLTVHFRLFWGLLNVEGDYKVIALDDEYKYIMVGGDDRKSLWIMSRDKTIPAEVLEEYKDIAEGYGFNTKRLSDSIF